MPTAESEPGVFFWGFFFPLFFWNSLKEIGKEGTGRADAVRSFGVPGDLQRALPKKPAPSLGFYCFTAKTRKAFPSEGFFKLETEERGKENKRGMNQMKTQQDKT